MDARHCSLSRVSFGLKPDAAAARQDSAFGLGPATPHLLCSPGRPGLRRRRFICHRVGPLARPAVLPARVGQDLGGPGTKPTGTGSAPPRAVGALAKDQLGLAGRVLTPPAPARPPPRGRGCARLGPVRPRRAGSNPTVTGPAPPCGRRCHPSRASQARSGWAHHLSLGPGHRRPAHHHHAHSAHLLLISPFACRAHSSWGRRAASMLVSPRARPAARLHGRLGAGPHHLRRRRSFSGAGALQSPDSDGAGAGSPAARLGPGPRPGSRIPIRTAASATSSSA